MKTAKHLLPQTLLGRSLLIIILPLFIVQLITSYVFYTRHLDRITSTFARAAVSNIASNVSQITSLNIAESSFLKDFSLIQSTSFTFFNQPLFILSPEDNSLNNSLHDSLASALSNNDNSLSVFAAPSDPESADRSPFFLQPRLNRLALRALRSAIQEQIKHPFSITENKKQFIVDIQLPHISIRTIVARNSLQSYTTNIFFMWCIGTPILFCIIAAIFMRNQVRPIRYLAEAAEELGKGREDVHLPLQGALEVRRATNAFNQMRDRLQRYLKERTTMLAAVSQDLRLPITRLKVQLALMPQNSAVLSLLNDVEDMQRMVEAYIDFSDISVTEDHINANIYEIIQNLANFFIARGLKVAIKGEAVKIKIQPNSFKRCINNILDNCKKYATKVEIEIKTIENTVLISVDDNGKGIPPDKLLEAFKPFQSLEKQNGRQKNTSAGLGLTIARDVIRRHGGDINLKASTLMGGLRVEINLPL